MEPVNLNGKILLIPMNAIDPQVRAAIKQEDGMQSVNGADIFVYATGQIEEHNCCGGHGHHHDEENGEEHHCCGGHGHHHDEENGEE
ncbi:MAG: hypothetical protein PHD21_08770, partial [Flavobacteriales bacterium]|nr:hypothetical protein [Flavobacteriales bacterium]